MNNLLFYSDLSSPRRLKGEADKKTMDRYLITQSCPWLSWDKILSPTVPMPGYLPQSNITISGKADFSETGQPLPDSTQIMFFLQKQIFGYEITTTSNGTFNWPVLFGFTGTDEVFFAASYKGKDLNNISLRLNKKDTIYGFNANPWTTLEKEDPYGIYQSQKKIIDQSFSFFSKIKERKDSISDPNAAIEDELQGADLVLKVNDFILFPTMAELIREVLKSVDYRRIGGRDVIRVYTTHKRPTNFGGPLYVIDGRLTKNSATFLNLKPSEIITIKVIKEGSKLAKFGSLGTNGVILVRTKNADRKSDQGQDNRFELVGMSPQHHEKKEPDSLLPYPDPSIPVLKPCLYWGVDHKLDSNGKASIQFTTSDDVGKFIIHIEGLTAAGRPFFAEDTFEVGYNRQ